MKQFLLLAFGVLLCGMSSMVAAFDFSFGYQRNGTEAVKSLDQVNVGGVDQDQKDNFLDVIKGVANWVFGILAFIALLILLYGGFLILTSAGDDDGYTKGLAIMKSAAIGLIIIGVAWFVVSGIIWLSQKVAGAAEGSTAGTDQ